MNKCIRLRIIKGNIVDPKINAFPFSKKLKYLEKMKRDIQLFFKKRNKQQNKLKNQKSVGNKLKLNNKTITEV